jgi:hypothetical protein
MHELDRRGFTEHFVLTNGRLLGLGSGKDFRPDAVLYALETRSGLLGTLADAFGVYADPGVGAFMKEVALRRPR